MRATASPGPDTAWSGYGPVRIRPDADTARCGYGPMRIRPGADTARFGYGPVRIRAGSDTGWSGQRPKSESLGTSRSDLASSSMLTSRKVTTLAFLTKRAER